MSSCPRAATALEGVELLGDVRAQAASDRVGRATPQDWSTEYLELKMSVRVVDSVDEAIAHINCNGSGHSEAIVTSDFAAAERFVREVDAAAVLVNASTRFVDGEEFGFGAEIGISTPGNCTPGDLWDLNSSQRASSWCVAMVRSASGCVHS